MGDNETCVSTGKKSTDDLIEQVNAGSVTDWRHYIYAGNKLVAVYSRDGTNNTLRYTLSDHQGSVSAITTSAGATYAEESFTAYGKRRDASDWSGDLTGSEWNTLNAVSRSGYTGHSQIGTMNLNHMNGRVQDAVTGVFLSADPYVTDPGLTQNYHRYGYVYNNPLSFTDPSGFEVDRYQCYPNEVQLANGKCQSQNNANSDDSPTLQELLIRATQWIFGAARILDQAEDVNTCQSPSGPYLSHGPCPAADEGNTNSGTVSTPTGPVYTGPPSRSHVDRVLNFFNLSRAGSICGGDGGSVFPNEFAGVNFNAACAAHDRCYASDSSTARAICDTRLRGNIEAAFDAQHPTNSVQDRYYQNAGAVLANTYFLAVTTVGWMYYEGSGNPDLGYHRTQFR